MRPENAVVAMKGGRTHNPWELAAISLPKPSAGDSLAARMQGVLVPPWGGGRGGAGCSVGYVWGFVPVLRGRWEWMVSKSRLIAKVSSEGQSSHCGSVI